MFVCVFGMTHGCLQVTAVVIKVDDGFTSIRVVRVFELNAMHHENLDASYLSTVI